MAVSAFRSFSQLFCSKILFRFNEQGQRRSINYEIARESKARINITVHRCGYQGWYATGIMNGHQEYNDKA